jgi:hypothetical protein
MAVTLSERRRTTEQLRSQSTEQLKELAAMMEHCNKTEREVLDMVVDELRKRRVKIEALTLGIEDANLPLPEDRDE